MASTKANTITFTFHEDVEAGDLFMITRLGVRRGIGWSFNAIALQPSKAGEPVIAVGTANVPDEYAQVPSTVQR